MFTIKYSKHKGIFYVDMIGKINHIEILKYIDIICETQVDCKSIIIITDYRNSTIDESSTDPIEKIGLHINSKMKKLYDKMKWSILSFNYLPTTGAILLYKLVKDDKLDMKPFTTIEGMLKWNNLTNQDLDDLSLLYEFK